MAASTLITSAQDEDAFQSLVSSLSNVLGPSSGIDSSDVDENKLQKLMEAYASNEAEWKQYFFPAADRAYTRNLVDKGNGKSNLVSLGPRPRAKKLRTQLILVWSPGKGSPIHDHANAHCIMKILKGSLNETRYAWPTVALNQEQIGPLDILAETTYSHNQVTYMSDKLGVHRISNPHPTEYAVSLHLYTPPNAAVYGCRIFDEQTGASSHMKQCTVHSEYGCEKREKKL